MARHIAAETGSYAAVYRVRTSTVCGHERCFNLGNFQIECVRHYGTTTTERRSPSSYGYGHDRYPGYISFPRFPDIGTRYRCLPLPRIIDISRRSSRNLALDYDMKFFTDGGTLSFYLFLSYFPSLSFSPPLASPIPQRTEITIMYSLSAVRGSNHENDEREEDIGCDKISRSENRRFIGGNRNLQFHWGSFHGIRILGRFLARVVQNVTRMTKI